MNGVRAFTLYEALVTITLAAIVLAVSGQILSHYGRLIRQSHTRAAAREAAAYALSNLSRELRGAVEWDAPGVGGTAHEARWKVYSRTTSEWIALADSPDWDAKAAGAPVADRVWLEGDDLKWGDGLLAEQISSFTVTRPTAGRLDLTLVVRDQQRSLTLQASVVKEVQ